MWAEKETGKRGAVLASSWISVGSTWGMRDLGAFVTREDNVRGREREREREGEGGNVTVID